MFAWDISIQSSYFSRRLKIKKKVFPDILQLRVTVVKLQLNENIIETLNSYSVSNRS